MKYLLEGINLQPFPAWGGEESQKGTRGNWLTSSSSSWSYYGDLTIIYHSFTKHFPMILSHSWATWPNGQPCIHIWLSPCRRPMQLIHRPGKIGKPQPWRYNYGDMLINLEHNALMNIRKSVNYNVYIDIISKYIYNHIHIYINVVRSISHNGWFTSVDRHT